MSKLAEFVEDCEYLVSEWLLLLSIYRAKNGPPTPDGIAVEVAGLWKSLYKSNKNFHLKFRDCGDSIVPSSGNNLEKILIEWANPDIGLLNIITPDKECRAYRELHYTRQGYHGFTEKHWREKDFRYKLSEKGVLLLKDLSRKVYFILFPLYGLNNDSDFLALVDVL